MVGKRSVGGSRITSISLDDETFTIKETLIKEYGFSYWVRECLRRFARERLIEEGNSQHAQKEEHRVRGTCNAMNPNLCVLCWPKGRPSRSDWRMWASGELEIQPEPEYVGYFPLPTNHDPEEESDQTPIRNRPKVGLVRRFFRWLI